MATAEAIDPAALDADALDRLRLIRTPSIGPITFRQLLGRFGSARAAIEALPDLARRGGGRAPAMPAAGEIAREAEKVRAIGGAYLLLGRPGYPDLLAELEDAPPALIVIGDAALAARPAVAMVGARNASAAAIRFARALAHDLVAGGEIVVSGLARGIDTAAHVGALDGGTIAVVAGGADIFYPPENERLQRAIGERGLLVAEQPPGTEPRARHFPYRNRIIAGLARGTVVVEAAPRSGSLITARLAAEAGREVMAVPGSPLDPRAQGCNLLIREGATLVQSAADIIEALQPLGGPGAAPVRLLREEPMPVDVEDRERRAIGDLLGPVPVGVDEIVRLSGLAPALVQTVLLEFELAGRLERHAGGRVSLCG
ncbi:DNA-processing protein DprA [Sphingomonas sp. BIUV-7]|uniref:DNA-processing protein DprA n=1 Tax=Sphingomonas natans TaxID=3063330 RepID=A0ABT8YEU5_9SPHN|nr:DNA-processing protein DprA [Sphingomonas sp. BIUV-7]MDO6416860.1 DNA-processing protein DprA [Sphingomonas sp. BIUV-7]